MHIKFFAPGSKDSHYFAVPKSQGYSHDKQSSLWEKCSVYTCTHTQGWRRKGEVQGGITAAVSASFPTLSMVSQV
jgi:hypothetical protein